jgi:hypothetical protein
MFSGHDIKATAELARPTVVGSANAMYVAATEQSMNEWLKLARLGTLGEAGPNQIGKGTARDSIDVLGGERQVHLKGKRPPEVDGGRYSNAKQILAAYRSLKSVERAPDGEITFWVILGKARTRAKQQYA